MRAAACSRLSPEGTVRMSQDANVLGRRKLLVLGAAVSVVPACSGADDPLGGPYGGTTKGTPPPTTQNGTGPIPGGGGSSSGSSGSSSGGGSGSGSGGNNNGSSS